MGDRTRFSCSAFSPAAARQTSVCLWRNRETGDHRLVTSISTRQATGTAWPRRGGRRGATAAAAARQPPCAACWPPHSHLPASHGPCRKSTEVLRINLRTGRLELENDAIAESSYANEVRRSCSWRRCAVWLCQQPPANAPYKRISACLFRTIPAQ